MGNINDYIALKAVKAVVFDVYGTIAQIRRKQKPFRQLLQLGERQGRTTARSDAELLMTRHLSFQEAAELLDIDIKPAELCHLERELDIEIASIQLFDDAVPALYALQKLGLKIGFCSNLAKAYADPVLSLVPMELDAYVWSFDVGAIKPTPAIFARVCDVLHCIPADVLMVGDTLDADVAGAQSFGMHALLIDRKSEHQPGASISSLLTLPGLISSAV